MTGALPKWYQGTCLLVMGLLLSLLPLMLLRLLMLLLLLRLVLRRCSFAGFLNDTGPAAAHGHALFLLIRLLLGYHGRSLPRLCAMESVRCTAELHLSCFGQVRWSDVSIRTACKCADGLRKV